LKKTKALSDKAATIRATLGKLGTPVIRAERPAGGKMVDDRKGPTGKKGSIVVRTGMQLSSGECKSIKKWGPTYLWSAGVGKETKETRRSKSQKKQQQREGGDRSPFHSVKAPNRSIRREPAGWATKKKF